LAITPHTIAVGTARYATVPVTLTVHNAVPITEVNAYHHVEEADLVLPSGELHINDGVVSDNPTRIVLAPGRYRLRVAHEPLTVGLPDTDEILGDHMTYRIWLWPVGTKTEPVVLLRGATTWAG